MPKPSPIGSLLSYWPDEQRLPLPLQSGFEALKERLAKQQFDSAFREPDLGPVRNMPEPERRPISNGRPVQALQPSQVFDLPGAVVTVDKRGAATVRLKPGYENGRSAALRGPVLVPAGPPDANVNANIDWAKALARDYPIASKQIFKELVPTAGQWDYKKIDPSLYEPFGNFHFGAAGRAVGVPGPVLRQEAGRYQTQGSTANPEWGRPGIKYLPFTGSRTYGDDPIDQFWITQGSRYFDERARQR
jgi:hypothetical protein